MSGLIGDYQVLEEVFRSPCGNCTVCLARHVRTNVVVGLRRYSLGEPSVVAAFHHEYGLYSNLFHPFISLLYERIDTRNSVALAIEWPESASMREFIAQHGPLSEPDARLLMLQMLFGLEYVHYGRSMVFGVLTGENVRLDRHGNVKIGHFSISHCSCRKCLDLPGTSEAFQAPELLMEQSRTPAADIWSLGVLLYAMVTGRLPFDDGQRGKLVCKILRDDPPFPVSMSPELSDLIGRMLAKDACDRITIENIHQHPWVATKFQGDLISLRFRGLEELRIMRDPTRSPLSTDVLDDLEAFGFDVSDLADQFACDAKSDATVAYYQILRTKMADEIEAEIRRLGGRDQDAAPAMRRQGSLPIAAPKTISKIWARPRAIASMGQQSPGTAFKKVEIGRNKAKTLQFFNAGKGA